MCYFHLPSVPYLTKLTLVVFVELNICLSIADLVAPLFALGRILMLMKGAPINKAYVVPLFALQAPPSIISWMKYAPETSFCVLSCL